MVAGRAAAVVVNGWTGTSPTGRERLHGERRVETTTVGRDFTILDAVGSGRMVSMVVDILGHEGSSAFETYLEGDDRVYVDDPFGNRIELLEPVSERQRANR